jgi:hypothetical protein
MFKKFVSVKDYLLLLIFILLLITLSGSWKTFNYPPSSVHQWRQSDCAAYVKTYFRTGNNLFEPATYNLAGKEGRVVSEFPIIYYLSAKIQLLTGEQYWVVRGLTFLCYLFGLLALLACIRKWIKHWLIPFFPIIILATSPYYYYYAINFLPNVPAISFSFIGLYFFLLYEERHRITHIAWGALFFILATALKPTDGGILWLAYLATKSFQFLLKKDSNKKIFLATVVSSVLIGLCILGWTKYVNWYNDQNGNHQNLIGIYPIWDMDKGLIIYTKDRIIHEWSKVFQHRLILAMWVIFIPIYIILWKKLNLFLRLFTLFIFLGCFAYSILWFKAFTDHDYYQLPFILSGVFLTITICEYFARVILPKLNFGLRNLSFGIILLLIIAGIYHNRNIQKERYTKSGYVYINPAIFEVEPYLRKLGVKTSDAVVCVPDKSPNISLNAINNYGYTEEFNSESYNIHFFKKQRASYLIISDSSYLQNNLYKPYLSKKIGEYKGIYVFDIR